MWLARYGNLVRGVAFFFLTNDSQLELLTPEGTLTRDANRKEALRHLTQLSEELGLYDA